MEKCGCFWRTPTILYTGELLPCVASMAGKEEMLLGKITKNSLFTSIWDGSKNSRFRELSTSNLLDQTEYCSNCIGGHCIPENMHHLSDSDLLKIIKSLNCSLAPKWLTLELSNSCNLKCIMCPQRKGFSEKGFMDFDLFLSTINNIISSQLFFETLVLHLRGEAFMHPRFLDILKILNQNRGFFGKLLVDTNGHFLSPEIIHELLLINDLVLTFSVDAINKSTYKRIREGGNFDLVMDNIQNYFKAKGDKGNINTRIQFIVQKENFSEIKQFVEYWKRFFRGLGLPFIVFDTLSEQNIVLTSKNQIYLKHLATDGQEGKFIPGFESEKLTEPAAINFFKKCLKDSAIY